MFIPCLVGGKYDLTVPSKVKFNLKTAVEGARGFYISRRGAETRRFMGVIRQLNALMLFTHKVKICKAVLFRSK